MNHLPIATNRMDLVPASLPLLNLIIAEDDPGLTSQLGAAPSPGWATFGIEPFVWTRDALIQNPGHLGWMTYLMVLRQAKALIGTCGFKGGPDENGEVEIGYEIAPAFRLKGLASEAAMGLVQHAFSFPEVTAVIAHTLAEENESGSVLKKVGMVKVDEMEDPDEGPVWQWRIRREDYAPSAD